MSNPSVNDHLQANFRTIGQTEFDFLEASLRKNFFTRNVPGYLATDWGKNDLEDHLRNRLNGNRKTIIPWLNSAKPLRDSTILEIGCGTGSSTVALAEQGAKVVGVDVDEGALAVGRDRCQAYGLEVDLNHANGTEVGKLFAARRFDYIIFYGSLEHFFLAERMSAMRTTWNMLEPGGLWCVIETPNRLWYYDGHTSLLPFFTWLPDELAFEYSRLSPRENYRHLYREPTEESKNHFLRRGRAVSFHEFELTMKPVADLKVKSSLKMRARYGGLGGFMKWRTSNDYRYLSLLKRIAPELDEAFLQENFNLIIEKD